MLTEADENAKLIGSLIDWLEAIPNDLDDIRERATIYARQLIVLQARLKAADVQRNSDGESK